MTVMRENWIAAKPAHIQQTAASIAERPIPNLLVNVSTSPLVWPRRYVGMVWLMDDTAGASRVVAASREVAAPAEVIFELIADPSQQPRWDGNDNLAQAPSGQRVRAVGDVFVMTITQGSDRQNHIVEFEEGRRIAWRPSEVGKEPPGHLWRWELEPLGDNRTLVTHSYDWSQLTDEKRLVRARATTADKLRGSIDRLAALAET